MFLLYEITNFILTAIIKDGASVVCRKTHNSDCCDSGGICDLSDSVILEDQQDDMDQRDTNWQE